MKTNLIFLLISIFMLSTVAINAQELIKEEDVPENVKRSFERRNKRATQIKWFKVDKKNYLVKFSGRNGKTTVHIDKEGVIDKTVSESSEDDLPSRAHEYLKENHRRKKIHEVNYVERGRKDRYYSVILHERQGRKKPPKVYEVQFDKSGRYITTFLPELEDDNTLSSVQGKTKFMEEVDEELDDLSEEEDVIQVDIKEIPTPAAEYLDKRFDYEYSAETCKIIKTKEYGQVYYIVMKKQGDKTRHVHYFDLKGKLLKKEKK